jgi:hypothetical protein
MGAPPSVPSYRSPTNPLSDGPGGTWQNWTNPLTPVIDPQSGGVAGAVVFLQEVAPQQGRPWNHPPVRVEVRDHTLHVLQGEADGLAGFVRRGQAVPFVSRQDSFVSIRLRGAAFFALPLPDRDQPRAHTFERQGIVELDSGSGQFWMRGYLFVADHPYFTRSDRRGLFSLTEVPAGDYQLVCWLPDWREAARELDADTGLLWRVTYRPAFRQVRSLRVEAGRTTDVNFALHEE